MNVRFIEPIKLKLPEPIGDGQIERNKVILCSKLKKIALRRNKTLAEACKEQGISTKTFYKYVKDDEIQELIIDGRTGCPLLTKEEIGMLIQKIEKHHVSLDCLDGKEVRRRASEMYLARTHETKEFTRQWWHRFLSRHSERIAVGRVCSLDDSRLTFTEGQIVEYQAKIEEALSQICDYRLLINMDETGFGRRMLHKKSKKIVFSKKCPTEPFWRAPSEMHHVSWVCGITASGSILKPLLVSTRKTLDPDFDSTLLPGNIIYSYSKKGYMTNTVMVQWIQEVLQPHVALVRQQLNQPKALAVLIIDGHPSHLSDVAQIEFTKIAPLMIIPLPAHSSHLTQPADLVLFSVTKGRFKNVIINEELSPFTMKLCKVYRAILSSADPFNIIASFKRAGFKNHLSQGRIVRIEIHAETFEKLRETARNMKIE